MTLTDVTSVLKKPDSIDSFSIEDIVALVAEHPNIPQIRAVLLQKRMLIGKEFPVDFADTNYYYANKQHFVNDVFQIRSEETVQQAFVQETNEHEPEASEHMIEQKEKTTSKIALVPESEADMEMTRFEESKAAKSHVVKLEASDTVQSNESTHALYNRLEASPYANWLLSLKQTNPVTTHVESAKDSSNETKEQISPDISDSVEEKTTEESSKQISDESSTLNKEIASESLAELLAKQGHQTKAIAMYEKLSLIFPEKRAYFASQIKKIKRK